MIIVVLSLHILGVCGRPVSDQWKNIWKGYWGIHSLWGFSDNPTTSWSRAKFPTSFSLYFWPRWPESYYTVSLFNWTDAYVTSEPKCYRSQGEPSWTDFNNCSNAFGADGRQIIYQNFSNVQNGRQIRPESNLIL